MPLWSIFGAIVPAVLLYIIIFMETQICQLIMMERTKVRYFIMMERTKVRYLIMMERTKVRYSLHHPLHGDTDLPAHHDGEDQGRFFCNSILLSDFIAWRYSPSCWYFRPSFVNCCPSNLLFGSSSPAPSFPV